MDELVPTKFGPVKLSLRLLLSFYIHCYVTQASYPLEKDVAELTSISPPKRWIPFMERLARTCINDVKNKKSMTFTDALKCMTVRDIFQCLAAGFSGWCILTHIHPNILKYDHKFPLYRGIHIIVHRQFSLNITVKYVSDVSFNDGGAAFEIMGRGYTGQNFSTLIIPRNRMKIIFYRESHIEYSVAQYMNVTNRHQIRANVMQFRRGYFLVTCLQIQVDIRARVSLDNVTCLHCKMIVYDGPTEKLPIIAKIYDANRFQRVVASTFQVFIVFIENVPQKDVLMTYSPIYKFKRVFNLTQYEYIGVSFDNNTWCDGHSRHARSCVYAFHTSTRKQILFSPEALLFTETYGTNKYKAAVIIFNHFQGITEDILELNYNFIVKNASFDIIGTGYTMQIVILLYSISSSLTFTFSMSLSDCDVLLVSGNYISYSGYVTPVGDLPGIFKMNQSLQALLEYDRCLRLQFMRPMSAYSMLFPRSTPVLIAEHDEAIGLCRSCAYPCSMSFEGPSEKYYEIDDKMVIRTVDSFNIKPCRFRSITIKINWLPCKLPCQYLFTRYCELRFAADGGSDNSTCDICENVYTGCTRFYSILFLKPTISFILRIKSNVCSYVHLLVSDYTSTRYFFVMSFVVNTTMFRKSISNRETRVMLISHLCNIEIPLVGLLPYPRVYYVPKMGTHDVIDVFWGGVLYRSVSQRLPVTWDTAAKICQEMGTSLLTIHSSAEYQFIKDTFLETLGTSILYVGVKREVICIRVLYVCASPSKWYSGICLVSLFSGAG